MKIENPRYSSNRSFMDFMFIIICGVTCFFILTLLQQAKQNEATKPKAEYLVYMTWPDKCEDDVDLWVKDPLGNIVWYREKENTVVHLDRDDLGLENDTVNINGESVRIFLNQEIVSIRGRIPGKWSIAVHFYTRKSNYENKPPIPVTVRLDKINPVTKPVFQRDVVLYNEWDQVIVATFEMEPNGDIINIRFDEEIDIVGQRISRNDSGGTEYNHDTHPH